MTDYNEKYLLFNIFRVNQNINNNYNIFIKIITYLYLTLYIITTNHKIYYLNLIIKSYFFYRQTK